MRTLKLAIPAAVLTIGFLICTSASYGKPEYAKKEGKTCTFCHVKLGDKELNDAGKFYQGHDHSLDGYKK
jgi:hypothetical protein